MENNKRNINWYDILSKIIFLIIIILILMWFFPRGTNNSNNNVNDKLDTINSKLTVLVDKVFRDNLNEMKAAAKAYFTKDRMPSEEGDSVKLTLQEMYDQNMLLPLMDKNNKACSAEKSYVKVTKVGNEWKMKVSLTCSGETKSIVETIGCYDFCKDGNCKNTIATNLQYQFVREVESTKYTCSAGYHLKGRYCYSEVFSDRKAAEEIWEKESTKSTDASKVEGGEKKTCIDAIETEGQISYTCPAGYTLNGTTCEKTETTTAAQGSDYSCPNGTTKNNNYCYSTSTVAATVNYSTSCPSGYTKSGSSCYKKVKSGYTSWKYKKSYSQRTYSREYKNSTSWLDYIGSYKAYPCNNGKYSRSCPRKVTYYRYRYYTRSATYSKKYASMTKKVSSITCPSGYSRNNNTCTKSVVTPATESTNLSCPDGYKIEGSTCSKVVSTPATEVKGDTTYSCDTGWALEGKSCCQTEKTDDKYYCEDTSAILEGNKCLTTVPAHIVGYKCPDGYTKKDNSCYKTVTKKVRATNKTVVRYQYKWSSFKSLYGWTRTGKTRSV